jgi:hypothetical protein
MSSSAASSQTTGSSLSSVASSLVDQFAGLHPPSPAPTMASGVLSTASVHFSHLITIKLSVETHLLWRAQVDSLLRSNLLHGFVDGTHVCPSPTLTATKDGVTTQDFIKFWGKIFVFILLVLIENPQGFKNFLSLFESFV